MPSSSSSSPAGAPSGAAKASGGASLPSAWAPALLALALAVGAPRLLPLDTPASSWVQAHANKPFDSFAAFYPFYLAEHSDIRTKRMHYAGTASLVVVLCLNPELALPLGAAGAIGFAASPLLRGWPNGLLEFASMAAVYFATALWALRASRPGASPLRLAGTLLAPMVIAYGFAWVGHFAFEGNKPATFIYPAYSLLGDLRMFYEAVIGQQPR